MMESTSGQSKRERGGGNVKREGYKRRWLDGWMEIKGSLYLFLLKRGRNKDKYWRRRGGQGISERHRNGDQLP